MKFKKTIITLGVAGSVVGGAFLLLRSRKLHQPRKNFHLENTIYHEIMMAPFYGVFDNIEYNLVEDCLTLSGKVTTPTLKFDVEKILRLIAGVAQIDNQIEFLSLSSNDQRIREAVYKTIYNTPGLDRFVLRAGLPIRIIVHNGKVTLEGVVPSEQLKILAGDKAKLASGLSSITNHLKIGFSTLAVLE